MREDKDFNFFKKVIVAALVIISVMMIYVGCFALMVLDTIKENNHQKIERFENGK